MAIILNDNIRINAGKPADAKYLSSANTPYASVAAVNTAITVPERHIGLTVNIMGVEYWYKDGVADIDLVLKTVEGGTTDAVTGATNIGLFQGLSGIQILPINHQTVNDFDGDYYSLYNYYYRGTDGKVHIGTPTDGILKRGYVKTASPVKSWIWNEYTGAGNLLGWILMDGNISQKIGEFDNGVVYYNGVSTFPYIQTSWSGTPPPNGSNVVIDAIKGSLATGSTIIIGGGVYAQEVDNVLEFRTIQSKSPETIAISMDEAFVYVSGKTQVGSNLGTGANVYVGNTGTTLQFRSICGEGGTVVTESGGNIVICGGGGGGGTYDLSSPAAICVGGICCGTILTGKTAFELFEELLVPELCGALTPQSGSISSTAASTYEIGCSASFNVCGVFSQGSINPQYCSASPFRVGAPTCYIFTGAQIAGAYACTTSPALQTVSSYTVVSGVQTWGVQTCYGAGVQPLSSKGNPFDTACIAGITPTATINVTGILPWYWGTKASGTILGTDVASGTKTVASVSQSTPITFNASSPVYLWFAAPTGTAAKNKWWVCASNAGNIGGTGNLWANACSVTVNSAQSCWSGCLYDVYVTCYPTTTATGIPMCLYY